MTENFPTIDILRDSFNHIYHGPNSLRREYDLITESERLGVPLDTYRRLYELRGEEDIDPYPKPKKWWHIPSEWTTWVWDLPSKKKIALGRKGIVKMVQSGIVITIMIGIGRYIWETPKREKLAHYQAWEMINMARGQGGSGGRIEAIQDLVKDGVILDGLNVRGATLDKITLQNAQLFYADLSQANINDANFSGAYLRFANLSRSNFINSNFNNAYLRNANFSKSDFSGASFDNADLTNVFFGCSENKYCTNFKGVKNITPEQIQKARNWQSACYDLEFRKKLGLSPENPKSCGSERYDSEGYYQ